MTRLFIALFFLIAIVFFLPPKAFAQTCSGVSICCIEGNYTYTPPGCRAGSPGCIMTFTCTNTDRRNCQSLSGQCTAQFQSCIDDINDGCFISGGGTPTPSPSPSGGGGYGACGSCSTCGFTSSECRTDPLGSCVWDPGSCNSGGGPCTVEFQSIPNLSVGQTGTIQAFARGGIEDWPGTWVWSGTNLGTLNPTIDPTGATYTTTFTPTQTGTSLVHVRVEAGDGTFQCQGSTPITVTSTPSCSISLSPDPLQSTVGQQNTMAATTTQTNGIISEVRFTSSNSTVATVISPDTVAPWTTNVTGVSEGSATVTAEGVMNGVVACQDTATVNTISPDPWFQAVGGDVIAGNRLISPIPPSCTLPSCNPNFIKDLDSYPGIALYNAGTADFSSGAGTGTVSSKGWIARSPALLPYSYARFISQIPTNTILNSVSGVVQGSDFRANRVGDVTDSNGYTWYRASGNLTIQGQLNLPPGRKVILFVDGNLNLAGKVAFASQNNFFLVISQGAISINPTVGGTVPNTFDLEGIYASFGQFSTGTRAPTPDLPLRIRGSVSAQSISLDRDLRANNVDTPGETFQYAPELFLNYPMSFSQKKLIWSETAP